MQELSLLVFKSVNSQLQIVSLASLIETVYFHLHSHNQKKSMVAEPRLEMSSRFLFVRGQTKTTSLIASEF